MDCTVFIIEPHKVLMDYEANRYLKEHILQCLVFDN